MSDRRPGTGAPGAQFVSTASSAPTPSHASPDAATEVSIEGASGAVPAAVRAFGAGRDLCFLHGLVGLNEHWDGVANSIAGKVKSTMLELPLLQLRGKDCSIQGVTLLTAKFLRAHFGKPVVLVGNSFGGHVALRLALEYPDLVGGLILAGSSGLIERNTMDTIEIRPSRAWLRRKIGELFYDQANVSDSDVERAYEQMKERPGARAMVRLSRSARKDHLGERIREIAQPTLLIWGREDIVTPPEAAKNFTEMLPDNRIVWLDECGHAPMIEKPAEFADAVLAFVDELDARDGRSAGA